MDRSTALAPIGCTPTYHIQYHDIARAWQTSQTSEHRKTRAPTSRKGTTRRGRLTTDDTTNTRANATTMRVTMKVTMQATMQLTMKTTTHNGWFY